MIELFVSAIVTILAVCIVVGAGLPALFALGVRWMAEGAGGAAEIGGGAKKPAFTALAYLCFALVLAVIGVGLMIIIGSGFGYSVSFDHIIPMLVKKKK